MRNLTHELIGVSAAVVIAKGTDADPIAATAAVAAALYGARLPDVDRLGARIHRRGALERRALLFAGVGVIVRAPMVIFALLARHRGVTHSWAACLLVAAAAAPAVVAGGAGGLAGAGLVAGYLAHVMADACTASGVSLYAPFSHRRAWLVPSPLRIRTGTPPEALVAMGVCAATVALLLVL